MVVACSVAVVSPYSPLVQVCTPDGYDPDRAGSPCVIAPTVTAVAEDGSFDFADITAMLTNARWLLDNKDIALQWTEGTDYDMTSDGRLTLMKNVLVGETHSLQFAGDYADARTGQTLHVTSEVLTLYTSESVESTWSVNTAYSDVEIYSPIDDKQLLREYQVAHDLTPSYTEAEAKDGAQYLREATIEVRIGGEVVTSGYTVKVFTADGTTETEQKAGEGALAALTLTSMTLDMRLVEDATAFLVRVYDTDGTMKCMRNACTVTRQHKAVDVILVNEGDLYEDTTTLWQQGIVRHNGHDVECGENVIRMDLYCDTYNETAHWLGQGSYVTFDTSALKKGTTTDTDYVSTYYEYDYKGVHNVAADASGVAYCDSSGEQYIFN